MDEKKYLSRTARKKSMGLLPKSQGLLNTNMDTILNILVDYGVLGVWVVINMIRERNLVQRMDDQEQRHRAERITWDRERTRWHRILGRKLSDNTFMEVQDD